VAAAAAVAAAVVGRGGWQKAENKECRERTLCSLVLDEKFSNTHCKNQILHDTNLRERLV